MSSKRSERIRIPVAVAGEIRNHALADAPDECCGLLVGRPGLVTRAVRARNLRASPTRYLVHPQDHFDALRGARAEGLDVVGAYHSHPTSPARPSPRDIDEARYPEFVYVIVSLQPGVDRAMGAFALEAGGFRELDIDLVP